MLWEYPKQNTVARLKSNVFTSPKKRCLVPSKVKTPWNKTLLMRVLALACCITWTIRPHKPTYPVRCDTGKWRVQRGQELVWKRRAKQTSNGRAARHVFENLTAIHGWLKESARWNKACENLNARGLSLSSAPGLLRSFEESTDCSTFINVLSSQQPGGLPRAHAFSCAVRNYALFPEFMRRISLV